MVEIVFIDALGDRRTVAATTGRSVMREALQAGVPGILGECGGALSCATCHVHVASPWLEQLSPPGPEETAMLELLLHAGADSRLSCQIRVETWLDGMTLRTPPNQF